MQHVEFFHKNHFENRYFRKKAEPFLNQFIDFFWETDFEQLLAENPQGFSDALFPNVGYTYLINLGTPFVMQLEQEKFVVKYDGFLPRHKNMICHHSTGNKIFGIKFNVSPVLFQKKINFSEYREYIFPLAYLIDRKVIERVRAAAGFESRVQMVSNHYKELIEKYGGSLKQVDVVTSILSEVTAHRHYNRGVEDFASAFGISSRTLQRYFEATTSITTKQALQILRIRKAVETLAENPSTFRFEQFGYYDYSHFHKHLKRYLCSHTVNIIQPHLQLLRKVAEI